jgi:formylmethanofuran dehydrogenase subunit E
MRVLDFGKLAATFVDTETGNAIRIKPHPQSRQQAHAALPNEPDGWQRQLEAYQFLPDEAILVVEPVALTVSMEKIISQPGLCVQCAACGEEISNAREVMENGRLLCRACAGESYYRLPTQSQPIYTHNGRTNLVYSNHFHYR